MIAADWLTEAAVTDTHLNRQLTERVLPLTCPLDRPGHLPNESTCGLARTTKTLRGRRIAVSG